MAIGRSAAKLVAHPINFDSLVDSCAIRVSEDAILVEIIHTLQFLRI